MAAILADRVLESSVSTGTGNFALLGEQPNYQSFASAVGVGVQTIYLVVSTSALQWEAGLGHLSDAVTLVRDTVTASSNAGGRVNFTGGLKNVAVDWSAWAAQPLVSLTPGQVLVGGSDGRVSQADYPAYQALTNGDAGSHTIGQAVYAALPSVARLAKADLVQTADCIGFCADASVGNAAQGRYQTAGVLGGLGLASNSTYYLSDSVAGAITTTPPTSGFLVEVGVSLSATELLIRPRLFVGL